MIGAAIGRYVCVMAKDAGADRMRRARAASRSARSRRERVQSRVRGFFAMSARSSPHPGRAWRDAMCCVWPRTSYFTPIDGVRCRETLCNLLQINSTSLFLITEMVTRSALLVSSNLFPSHTKTLVGTRPVSQCHSDAGAWLVVVPSRRGHANIPHAVHNSKTSRS